ncbi:hypothetical protein HT102_10245 [Hoyosella sp. G463]|uniref:Uncharacterized protein n=1 Tax=Lolliginicoccus lacisalsi TaxID=2742202 RepID=A0A927PLI4_9ACTN|nr:hypothetical protein [Lolliginicoccus lacisalsi]MBD8506868.1 hypothetical protein [Lolliginicoccus lacisalsi]
MPEFIAQILAGSLGGTALGLGGLALGIAGAVAGPQLLETILPLITDLDPGMLGTLLP